MQASAAGASTDIEVRPSAMMARVICFGETLTQLLKEDKLSTYSDERHSINETLHKERVSGHSGEARHRPTTRYLAEE